MWFSVVCTLIDIDARHHSGQNVVDSQGAVEGVHNILTHIATQDFEISSYILWYKKKTNWRNELSSLFSR